jgi:hypothetical protein
MMKYKIEKQNLKDVREYLIEMDLEFHRDFEMNFRALSVHSGIYVLEFFKEQDELAFLLKFDKLIYEKSHN